MKMTSNILGGLLFVGISLFILLVIPDQVQASSQAGINAQSFPRWIATLMLVCSVFLLVNEVRLQRKNGSVNISAFNVDFKKEIRAVLFIVLIVAYALATPFIGFLFASMAFSALALLFFNITNIKFYIFLIVCCVVVHYVFKFLLLVQLP
ncbi:tripartite tricarboxylate transporter TctB family protein [Psychromonas sp. SR45-3]|uniref:tripartite tricarboxylate transporter TctB family protein n=1 Tax=Psychromonas sp. SR45-3 TaxID=2760930 RepID=UPI0015F9CAED|nr:tripartite tricarboxylate transporter TctB family protein [Psychromonas sp. SR45-3]MBB1274732.1 tripartite tricarboxylate transporter TctB family protein [Psychromonas sp. SR45-3]